MFCRDTIWTLKINQRKNSYIVSAKIMYQKRKCYASIPKERSTSAVTNVEVTTSCISWNCWKSTNVTKMTPNSADYITSMSTLSVNLEKMLAF
ncbi:unnamed protein product [Tenebrio molitor]|nr:unnamed protein product [Tenebrio molitor]